MAELLKAVVLGLVEGATEFIPVSSTGHLIVAGDLLGFDGPGAATFEIVIQLGAILAVVWLYRGKLLDAALHARRDPLARRLALNLAVAFMPAALGGYLFHESIKQHLFDPVTVAIALVMGGIGILAVERWKPPARVQTTDEIRSRDALGVGLAQVLSLIPGVSRSAATIMGGMAIGLSRPAATEFSFFVAVPIMLAATLFELAGNLSSLTTDQVHLLIVGFVTAFVSALIVVRALVRFVSLHSFRSFAWYRIALGIVVLVAYQI